MTSIFLLEKPKLSRQTSCRLNASLLIHSPLVRPTRPGRKFDQRVSSVLKVRRCIGYETIPTEQPQRKSWAKLPKMPTEETDARLLPSEMEGLTWDVRRLHGVISGGGVILADGVINRVALERDEREVVAGSWGVVVWLRCRRRCLMHDVSSHVLIVWYVVWQVNFTSNSPTLHWSDTTQNSPNLHSLALGNIRGLWKIFGGVV